MLESLKIDTKLQKGYLLHFLLIEFSLNFSITVTGLHDIDEYIQAQLLLAVSRICQISNIWTFICDKLSLK